MKILTLCGVFAKENEKEIIHHAKKTIEYSANVFQEKLINGFLKLGYINSVVSAPFIGSYPNASDIVYFRKFEKHQNKYNYVPFLNIWGIRNYSRTASLKKNIKDFIKEDDSEKLIIVYSPHTPFLEAAVYAKKRDPRIKICLIVPDLPQYMNLNSHVSIIYRVGKKYDILKFNKLNKHVDSYVLLTEAMKDVIDIHNCSYSVIEGIFEPNELKNTNIKDEKKKDNTRYIVYTGKTNEKFGVKKLVDAFTNISGTNLRLIICGSGDADTYIAQKAKEDLRIIPLGQVSHEKAVEWIQCADVLVNPRQDNEEYTKYSFPSKNIEYLSSGNPTVGYVLRGMKPIYKEFMFCANDDGLETALIKALNVNLDEYKFRLNKIKKYLKSLSNEKVAQTIIDMTFKK